MQKLKHLLIAMLVLLLPVTGAADEAITYTQNTAPVSTDQGLGIDDPSGTWTIQRFAYGDLWDHVYKGYLDTLAELNAILSDATLLDDGAIGDSVNIGLTAGDNYTSFGDAADDSINELFAALDAAWPSGSGAPTNADYWVGTANATLSAEQVVNSPATLESAANLGAFFSDYADDADAAAMRTTLGLAIGSDVQAYDADLADLADGTLTGSKLGECSNSKGALPTTSGVTDGYVPKKQSDGSVAWEADSTGAGGDQLVDLVATSPLTVNGGAAVNDALPGSDADIIFNLPAATNAAAGHMTAAQVTALEAIDTEAELEALLDLPDLQGAVTDAQVPDTITVDTATVATTLTVTDNEATNENNALLFTSGGDLNGGDIGIESDGDLYYNPSTGVLYASGGFDVAASNDPYNAYKESDGTDWWSGIDDAGNSFEWRTNETVGNSVQMELDEDGDLDIAGNFNITGEITGKLDIDAHTATGSIATQACYGGVVTNTGATGAIVLTLPDAVQGMSVLVCLTVAQDVDINPNGTERILVDTDANGDALSSDATIGTTLSLVAVSATQWLIVGKNGTWTDAN